MLVQRTFWRGLFLTAVFAAVFVVPTGIWAAPAPVFQYQAQVNRSSGGAVSNGTYTIVFSIYDVASGGTALWSETHSVAIDDSLAAATLGTLSPITIDFNGSEYYLGVKIGSDSELSPRKRLGAAPLAANSKLLDGRSVGTSANNIPALDANQDLVLPAQSIQGSAITNGAIEANKLSVAAINSDGKIPALTSTYLANLDGSALTGIVANSAAAGTLTGTTLASNVVASSLTSLGTLSDLNVSGNIVANRSLTVVRNPDVNAGNSDPAIDITFNTPADTSGTNNHTALTLDLNIANSTGGTNSLAALEVEALTGDPQVDLTALDVENLTNGNDTDSAIAVGTGWGNDIELKDSTVRINMSSDDGRIDITDDADPSQNTLFTFDDIGTVGNFTATGDITVSGGDINGMNSASIDIGEASAGSLSFSAASTGDYLFNTEADSNFQINQGGAGPAVDMVSISNATLPSTTDDVDGLAVRFDVTNANGSVLNLTPIYAGGATDNRDYNVINIDPFSPTNAAGQDTMTGIRIGAMTDPGATISSTAIFIHSGWETDLSFSDTSPRILFTDASTLTVSDGTNTLLTLADGGTSGNLSVTGTLSVGGGTAIAGHISGTLAANLAAPGAVPGCVETGNVTVTNAALGDTAVGSMGSSLPGPDWTLTAYVNGAGTARVRLCQLAGAAADPDGGGGTTYRVDIWKH
ncbi:hypothetical protein HY374_01060 [Candidatus Berkelbacteria bacterium]|nr:hypothetical protein [Candidatus Berkelbacteria bacterium]